MGGWVAATIASRDARLRGAVLISAADMGVIGAMAKGEAVTFMKDNMESLANTPETLAEDLVAGATRRRLASAATGLARMPMLVLSSDDGLAPHSDSLVAAARRLGNGRVTTVHAATDHAWSDRRVMLASTVLRWLERLPVRSGPR